MTWWKCLTLRSRRSTSMNSGKLEPGWTRVAFSKMAACVNDRIENPADAGVKRYVGLEHLDPDSLTIRRWGMPSDVSATKLRFRAGDIIFGRRRVYQRKLAVADFDGICSAHGLVLRAKPEVVLPAFLPFFMRSDRFIERAISISVGSLSPTINWKTLAEQEFAVPPLAEQRRVANALSAVELLRQRLLDLLDLHETTSSSFLFDGLRSFSNTISLEQLTNTIEYGTSLRTHLDKSGVPVLRIPNVLRGTLDFGDLKHAHLSPGELARFRLNDGDVLMVRTNGNPDYVGRCVVVPKLPETMAFASYLLRIVPNATRVRPKFVAAVLNAASTRRQLRALVRSSAGNYNISASGLRSVDLPCPALKEQDFLLAKLVTLSRAKDAILLRLATLKQVRLL